MERESCLSEKARDSVKGSREKGNNRIPYVWMSVGLARLDKLHAVPNTALVLAEYLRIFFIKIFTL